MKLIFSLIIILSLSVLCKAQPSAFIENGFDSNVDWVCYIVSKIEGNTDYGYLHTGSFITTRHILTVAQAIDGYFRWTVGYGTPSVAGLAFVDSFLAIFHENFDSFNLNNNIGIIILEEGVSSNMPILASPGFDDPIFAQMHGFGISNSATNELPNVLQSGFTQIITNAECRETFGNQIVNSGVVCALPLHGNLCYGDQGGPLMDIVKSELFAIASFWMSPCDSGRPMGFVRVAHHLNWINSVVNMTNYR